jgi:predicted metal-dependent phosphoesterase TrpH
MRGRGEAADAAKDAGIEFVPGIEISSVQNGRDLHMLGYFVGYTPEIEDYEEMMHDWRTERYELIVEKLQHSGIDIEAQRAKTRVEGVITRSHVARWLVDAGYVDSVTAAFDEYLGPGRSAYVLAGVVTAAEAIDLIHRAGGCASLAHPGEWMSESVIDSLIAAGLDAIEVVHPAHDQRLTEYYEALAHRKGLLRTGGSDLHSVSEGTPARLGSYGVSADDVRDLRARAPAQGDHGVHGLNQTRR